jgi:hypothetical protein
MHLQFLDTIKSLKQERGEQISASKKIPGYSYFKVSFSCNGTQRSQVFTIHAPLEIGL